MINNFVGVLRVKPIVGLQSICIKRSACCNIAANFSLEMFLFSRTNNRRTHLAGLAIQQTKHDSLSFWAATVNLFGSLVRVHEPCFATDKSFVGFEGSSHLVDRAVVHCVADSVQHEPRGFLSDAQRSCDLV